MKENSANIKAKNPVNLHVETSRDVPYVPAKNLKYLSENSVTTRGWTEMETRKENETFLRALQGSLNDATENVGSQEEAKRCNTFVCYCQEENCARKSSKTSLSRILGSSRRTKPGRVNYRRPIGSENAGPITILRSGLPGWYHEARHEPYVPNLINSVPMHAHQEITHPAFFAPLLHGVPLVAPSIIGKDGKMINAAFPYTSFDGRPDFTVGDSAQHQRRPIFRQDSQDCRYLAQENRFETATVSTTSAWVSNTEATVNLNEESGTTDFSPLHETITANYLGRVIDLVTKNNVELKGTIETTEISEAETLPTDHVVAATETGANGNFESYSSSGTFGANLVDKELSRFIKTPEISYANARTDSATRSDLNPYYSETTTMSAIADQSESPTGLFRETTLSWTDKPDLGTGNNFDWRMNNLALTSTEAYEYTRPLLTEFYPYVETTERPYEPNDSYDYVTYSNGRKLPSVMENKRIPMKKLTGKAIDEIEESTTGELLGKSKSYTTKMLMDPSYEGESVTENSLADDRFFYSTISHEFTTNAIRENSWTSSNSLPFSRGGYGGEATTPYYDSTTERFSIDAITKTYPWKETLHDRLTTMAHSIRGETSDDNTEDPEDTIESLVAITDSSTKRLPSCDKSLLLSSIKRVINNFASSSDLTKTQDLDENVLQSRGESLLPEILQIPNLKSILSTPQIEDTIVQKVKDVLSNVADKAHDWSHGVIRNALRNLLEGFRDHEHERKLPPMTVKEHQFDHGQWHTKLVTLAPVHGKDSRKLSMAPGNLRESIRDILGFPAVTSQADQQVVRNMIVQSLKNTWGDKAEDDGQETNDSMILDVLDDVLQRLRGSKDMKDTSKEDVSSKVKSVNKDDTNFPQETSTRYENEDNHKTEGNAKKKILSGMKQSNKNTPVDGTRARKKSYKKVEKLDNNLQILITSEPPDLMKLGKQYEGEGISLTANLHPEATTISSTDTEVYRERTENVLNSIENVAVQQSNGEARNNESWERTTTYQKPSEIYNPQDVKGCMNENENVYAKEGIARDSFLDEKEQVGEQHDEIEKPWTTTISIDNNIKVTIASPQTDSPTNEIDVRKWENMITTNFDEVTTEITKQDSLTSKSLITDEAPDKALAAAAFAPNLVSSSADDEAQINTTVFYNESHLDSKNVGTTKDNECFPKYDEIDSTIMRATNDLEAPPINYYSPNDRILNYVKNHRIDNEDETTTTTITTSSMRKSSSDYTKLSDNVALNKNAAAATSAKHKIKYALDENVSSPNEKIASDSISTANANEYENRRTEVSSANADSLPPQQQGYQTGDVIKIHEVTTEMQKTYEKTLYFQPRQFSPEDDSKTDSPVIAYEVTSVGSSNDHFSSNCNNRNDNNDPSDEKIDNFGDVATEANRNIVSATGLPSDDVSNTVKIFPFSDVSEESIAQLKKSQLYYINDGVKLPLEIRRLKDGAYALSISKDICEQILKRKCCVPLQGHVVQSTRPNTNANDIEENYKSVTQPLSSTTTLRNTLLKLEEEAEEELNMHRLSKGRWKRDLIEDDSMAIVSMPVLDFARKYNLSLDFNEKQVAMNGLKSRRKIRNFGDSLKQLTEKSERNRLKETNFEMKRNEKKSRVGELPGSVNTRNEDILEENVENLTEAKLQKSRAKASRSERIKTSRLSKLEAEGDDQRSVNVRQIMDPGNQASDTISKGTNIFEGETKFKSNEMKWGKLPNIKENNYFNIYKY